MIIVGKMIIEEMIIVGIIERGVVGEEIVEGEMVMIKDVFIYFEILARSPRVRVRSAEVCFDYIFTINLTTN
jgi:hypothetical protein